MSSQSRPLSLGLPYVRISSGLSGSQAHGRTSVRIFKMTGFTPENVTREEFGCNKENLTYSKKLTSFRQWKKIHYLHCLNPLLMRKWMSLLVQAPVKTEN
ncbi:hypothetical protein AVEN_129467-1 [Araneus ventricosus]|uniref:Uncharacterized protein n=1 Tax=Araneus ventricosus TaxID=182803 RepID=A0A4Y2MBA9_ARAVE|nr:hypothetical protein AVEN_129467-1 [Araneus ventricosus]